MKRRVGDRRGKPRFEIVGDLWASVDATSSLVVRNIGLAGALVESRKPLAADSVHWTTAIADGQPHLLQIRVRHCTPAPSGDGKDTFLIGVEFLKVSPAFEDDVARQVAAAGGATSVEA